MPESLRLPPEPSEERREVQRLRAELDELKTRSPVLELFAKNAQGLTRELQLLIRVPSEPSEADIRAKIDRESMAYHDVLERLQGRRPATGLGEAVATLTVALHRAPTPEETTAYVRALTGYLTSYAEYLKRLHVWSRLSGRANHLKFVVCNGGRAEAEAVHIILHFPDNVVLQKRIDAPPEQPAAPRDPTIPQIATALAGMVPLSSGTAASLLNLVKPGPAMPNTDIPKIRTGNSIEVVYGPRNVRHKFEWYPDPVWIVLPERVLDPFDVRYVMSARNLPQVVEGIIRITPAYEHAGPWLPAEDGESA